MNKNKNAIIKVCDLSKGFEENLVLDHVNLTIYEGETLVILGRSGVGKSVLLKQIIGIDTPDSGYVEVEGKRISELSEKEKYALTKDMGILFQGGALFDSMTVGENTAFYLREHKTDLTESEIQTRVEEALEMVGLADTQEKMPSDLSGGMKRRAALARLIIYRPRIVLYDEPTTGLDPITAMHINELIIETQEKLQATSIVVTHDIRSAVEVGNRLAFQNEQKIQHVATKTDFFQINDKHLQAFFENAILRKEALQGSNPHSAGK